MRLDFASASEMGVISSSSPAAFSKESTASRIAVSAELGNAGQLLVAEVHALFGAEQQRVFLVPLQAESCRMEHLFSSSIS